MGINETILFYLLIGAGVSVAVLLSEDECSPAERSFQTATAVLFWPLFLPVLLRRPHRPDEFRDNAPQTEEVSDGMSAAISQVEAELDAALRSLDGWAEGPLAQEYERLSELRTAWHLQAERVRELDRLLRQPEFGSDVTWKVETPSTRLSSPKSKPEFSTDFGQPSDNERILHSEQARHENIQRLREVRRQLHDDLMGTLAWVRELVTMIHLAKFTGAPPSRAEELVAQIAASVEGLSEVTHWQNSSELVGSV